MSHFDPHTDPKPQASVDPLSDTAANSNRDPSSAHGDQDPAAQALATVDPAASLAKSSDIKAQEKKNSMDVRELLVTLFWAVLLTVAVRTFVAEARWIPSNSMLPSLEVGDRLIVEKISYLFREPRRGDIIVFNPPDRLNFDGAYIKRVIGLPGDRIRIADGLVEVNGTVLDEADYTLGPPAYTCPGTCQGIPTAGPDFEVPPNQYFVLGDNRNDSQDSHFWGFLDSSDIIGHTIFRFWPPHRLHYFGAVPYDNP